MKKLFLGMLAIVAMIATSCVQEQDLVANTAGEAVAVSFNVGTPAMRANFSDGATATHLQYAVYDANGNILSDLTVLDGDITGGSTTVTLQLVTGNNYSVLFWAAAPNAPYTVAFGNALSEATMTVDYTAPVCSDENRDAFYTLLPIEVKGAMTVGADLKRPFAQLNIGTNDYDEATSAGYTVSHAKVATSAYTTLNFADGSVSTLVPVEFAYAAVPTAETFPVATYEYMAMNYLLMAKDPETVDVTFYYATDAQGANEKSRTVGSVPVQRNHRTNLYGALLTSLATVNVEIKPVYDEPAHNNGHLYYVEEGTYYITSGAGLVWFAEQVNNGNLLDATVVLDCDVDLASVTRSATNWTPISNSKEYAKTFRGTFDGNGHSIKNMVVEGEEVSGLFGYIYTATIKNVTIENATVNSNYFAGALVAWVNDLAGNDTLPTIIENCHVVNSNVASTPALFDGNMDGGCKVGGLIGAAWFSDATNAPVEGAKVANCSVSSTTVSAYRDLGGFIGYIEGAAVEACEVSEVSVVQDLTNGYEATVPTTVSATIGRDKGNSNTSIEVDEKTTTGTQIKSNEELKSALRANATLVLANGEYALTNCPAGLTLIGGGDNVTVDVQGQRFGVGGNVTVENVKLVHSNNGYEGFQHSETVVLKGCTIVGQPFLYGKKVVIEDCTFEQNDTDQYNVWTYSADDVTFNNCVFNCAGRCVLIYQEGDKSCNVTFNGCTFNSTTAVDGKAAVEIGSNNISNANTYTVTLNNSTATGFGNGSVSGNPLWNQKNGNRSTISVDGVFYAVAGAELVGEGLYKSGSTYSVANAEGLATLNSKLVDMSAGRNVSVEILADIDFTGKTWTPVKSHVDWNLTVNSFNGNGHTISNLTINGQAMFTIFANGHDVVFKNLTFDNAKVNSTSINSAIIVGQTYNNLLLDNVDVKNSTIVGGYKVSTLVATVYNESSSSITATLKNCDVTNTTVKALSYDFCTTGLVAFVYADDNDYVAFENCTISNVSLYGPTTYGYKAHAAIYTTGSETLFNEAEGVTVTNVTFENI